MALLYGLAQLLIDSVARDHLVAVIGTDRGRQFRGRDPASICTCCLIRITNWAFSERQKFHHTIATVLNFPGEARPAQLSELNTKF